MTQEINENETLDELLARAHGEEQSLEGDMSTAEAESDNRDEASSFEGDQPELTLATEKPSNDAGFSLEEKAFYEERLAQMQAEMAQMANENRYWQGMAHSSSRTAHEMGTDVLLRMKQGAEAELKAAKMSKKAAYESGDLDAQVAADEELMKATATLHWIGNQPAASQKTKTPASQNEHQRNHVNSPDAEFIPQTDVELHPAVQAWVEKNPWMDELDPFFEPAKAESVVKYATQLERSLIRSGREYEINSPSYFQRLDHYVQKLDQASSNVRSENRAPLLKPAVSQKESTSQTLSPLERELCQSLGISQKSYLKNREYDRKQQAFKQGSQIYGEVQ